ncbi:hypothetical protein [uncultured Novosphingobium sp.]|uniref:hypothetical protein n=1 Tax=uncultured Novosphingobium sp. TaxID=292277 RepID=UPI003747CF4D
MEFDKLCRADDYQTLFTVGLYLQAMLTALFLAPAAAIALPANVRPTTDIPMVAIGLPFSPESPEPVATGHPLYKKVAVGDITDLPATIKSSSLGIIAAAKRSSVNAAFRDSLSQMNLLADNAEASRFKLTARWIESKTPFRIATHNASSVTLHYQLSRLDNQQVLFTRDITTSATGAGGFGSVRDNGILRAAIASNFASVAKCLDDAAYGRAATDCALTPRFSVSVTRIR